MYNSLLFFYLPAMSELLTFDRWFEVKTFNTPMERNIFALREYLIRTGVNVWLHRDMIEQYMQISDVTKRIEWLEHYFVYLSKWKLRLHNEKIWWLYVSKLVFVDDTWKDIDIFALSLTVWEQIGKIIWDDDFTIKDLHIESQCDHSQTSAIIKLFNLLQKKFS